ncbi:hypothetical protein FOA52_000416 [Chlamydomonas sp. UWO 241]|nr:hypothetical protein FOA52_000416 [Chlamydomonas sp. UWO 241]
MGEPSGKGEGSKKAADGSKVDAMEMQALSSAIQHIDYKKQAKEKYTFWETQPVSQFKDTSLEDLAKSGQPQNGAIDELKRPSDVRQEPLVLPDSFEWCTCDLSKDSVCKEVYDLLSLNYVEDDDNMFRFNYSPEFLKWALQPPGWQVDWIIGVRVAASKKLVGFISAIPANVRTDSQVVRMVEINFLCVHKKLRSKRLAPVLIKEITRRVNLCNIWQAAYTAGVLIPKPIATCRYWHRSLNPKKLIDVGFSRLAPRMTMARTIKLYSLPESPVTPGVRPLEARDVPAVTKMLNEYLGCFRLTQVYDEEEVKHWFTSQKLVIDAYVVETNGKAQAQQIASLVDVVSLLVSRVPGAPMQMPHAEPARARAGHAAHSAAPRAAPAAEAAQPARPAAAAAPVASGGGGPATERPASGATRAASARGPSRRGGLPARVGDTSLRRSFVLSIPVARGANWFLAGGGRRMDEEEATAAERIAAAAEDGTSLPVRLATDVVRFLYGGTGRREPADGGVVSASLLNAKPAVGGIGVEPRGGGVLRVLFTVASDAVADTVVRWRHELRRCVDSTAVFDVLSDREEAQHQALWPAFLAAKVAGKRAQRAVREPFVTVLPAELYEQLRVLPRREYALSFVLRADRDMAGDCMGVDLRALSDGVVAAVRAALQGSGVEAPGGGAGAGGQATQLGHVGALPGHMECDEAHAAQVKGALHARMAPLEVECGRVRSAPAMLLDSGGLVDDAHYLVRFMPTDTLPWTPAHVHSWLGSNGVHADWVVQYQCGAGGLVPVQWHGAAGGQGPAPSLAWLSAREPGFVASVHGGHAFVSRAIRAPHVECRQRTDTPTFCRLRVSRLPLSMMGPARAERCAGAAAAPGGVQPPPGGVQPPPGGLPPPSPGGLPPGGLPPPPPGGPPRMGQASSYAAAVQGLQGGHVLQHQLAAIAEGADDRDGGSDHESYGHGAGGDDEDGAGYGEGSGAAAGGSGGDGGRGGGGGGFDRADAAAADAADAADAAAAGGPLDKHAVHAARQARAHAAQLADEWVGMHLRQEADAAAALAVGTAALAADSGREERMLEETHIASQDVASMDGVDRYASGSAYHLGTESYTFFWGGGAGPSAGVAILVRSDLVAALQPAVQADGDGRLMVMDIVWGGGGVGGGGAGAGGGGAGRLRLINAYLPASQPNRPAVQAAFIKERIRPHAAGQQRLVLAGDFNFVESPRDRARSEGPLEWRDRAPTAAMAALVEDAPLCDAYRLLHPMQRGYTFTAYNAQARLDRFYVSPALVPRVFGCDAGESGGSDHRVVALHLTPLVPEARGPGRPRVRALFWADSDLADGFRAWFGQQAAEAPTHSHAELIRWWQAFKPRLAREARRLDCDLGRRRDAVSVEVTRLRADLKRARAAVEAGRDGLAELAELYALQRRLDVAVQRYALADIMAEAVAAVSRPPPPSPADREAVLAAVRTHSPRVPQAVADAAGAPAITPAEVRAAAMHSKPGTAPGPDGIPVDVWRKLGEPAFVLLAAVFTAVGATGETPPGFLDGVVASIYKAKDAADAANYRPLTMLGSDYRILAKVLATRWTPLLAAVVGPEQTAFLAGRRISDNICLTQMLPGLLATSWPRASVGPDPPAELPRWASSVPGGLIGECMGPAVTAALMPGPLQRMLDGVQALGPVARIPGRVLTAELWGAEAPLWANPLLQLELPAAQRTVDWRKPPVAVVLAALPTAWVEAAAGGAALTVLRPLRQFSPLPQEGERAAVVEILRLVGWQLPGIITPAGWRRGRPGLRSTAARPAPQPAAAGGGAAGEPRWVGFAHGPGVVGKLTCKLAVALQLRAVVDERRVRRAATVEAALALDHGPHGGPRASDVQVCAGLRGLEAAVPALWRVPLLNARKEPIWRLWIADAGHSSDALAVVLAVVQAQTQQIASLVDLVHLLVSRVPGAPMQMPHAVPHAAHSAPRAAPAAKAAQPARPAAAAAPVAAERPAAAGAARAASARGPSRRGGLPARVGETSLCRSHVLSIPVAAATRLIASRGSEGQMARDGIVRGALRDASYLGSTRHVRRLFSDCYGPEETAVAAAAVRVAAAAADGVSLPVCLAMNLVRFVHDVSGRDRPAGGGVVSASFLNAKPAVGGIGVEPRRGGVLRVLFTVASDAVADTVVRSRRNLRDVDLSAAVFDVTDMLSFYTLPSTILGHPDHNELRAAYMYYTVPGATPLKQLVNDAMILAASKGYDVFNALDLQENSKWLKELKFGIGDGSLHYYLFNWRVTAALGPSEVGLILM